MRINKIVMLAAIASFSLPAVSYAEYDGAVTAGNTSVWRMDSTTGSVSLCSESGKDAPPDCYPPSPAEKNGEYRILVGNDILSTWRINVIEGKVSKCEYEDTDKAPECTPWSK